MKMKTVRNNAKLGKPFKHRCGCMSADQVEYLDELPESVSCSSPKFWERSGDNWVDVTDRVEITNF